MPSLIYLSIHLRVCKSQGLFYSTTTQAFLFSLLGDGGLSTTNPSTPFTGNLRLKTGPRHKTTNASQYNCNRSSTPISRSTSSSSPHSSQICLNPAGSSEITPSTPFRTHHFIRRGLLTVQVKRGLLPCACAAGAAAGEVAFTRGRNPPANGPMRIFWKVLKEMFGMRRNCSE